MKLGKLAPKNDPRTLHLSRYLGSELPSPPPSVDYSIGVSQWPMYQNDRYGDCTCATAGHMIQAWTQASRGDDAVVTDDDVLKAYSEVTGFNPNDPSTDRGAVEHDVLKYWRTTGIGGHKIGAWVDIDPKDENQVKTAIWLFGGLYIGVALPKTAQNQQVWDYVRFTCDNKPYSWGGHAVNPVRYNPEFIWVPTWGAMKAMTWKFWMKYVDEAHAILTEDWLIPNTSRCPAGFDIEHLRNDLAAVTA